MNGLLTIGTNLIIFRFKVIRIDRVISVCYNLYAIQLTEVESTTWSIALLADRLGIEFIHILIGFSLDVYTSYLQSRVLRV